MSLHDRITEGTHGNFEDGQRRMAAEPSGHGRANKVFKKHKKFDELKSELKRFREYVGNDGGGSYKRSIKHIEKIVAELVRLT
jgi:hypothetical protein